MHDFSMAFADLRASFERIGLAWSLAWHDVVSRYRGSILGPFWITLSMGLMVAGQECLSAIAFRRFLRTQKASSGRPFESGKATYRPSFFAT